MEQTYSIGSHIYSIFSICHVIIGSGWVTCKLSKVTIRDPAIVRVLITLQFL